MNIVLVVLASSILCLVSAEGYKRVCYYSNWSQYRNGDGKFFPTDIDPTLCTHLIYSFAKLDNNHELAPYEWNDISRLYKEFNGFKVGSDIKTLLAIGGWNAGSKLFSEMVSSKNLREKFANKAVDFIIKHDFDGLDLDWEYPANREGSRPSDKANFITLLEDIRKAMKNAGKGELLLTAAVAAGKDTVDKAYDVRGMVKYLDFINLMSYDLRGAWDEVTGHQSPLYNRSSETFEEKRLNVDWAARYWVELGTPKEKLIIGLPTYGRHFTLKDSSNYGMGAPVTGAGTAGPYTREPGFLAYYEICAMIEDGANIYWHEEHKVPYLVKDNQWVGYDDEISFALKLNYIMDNSYGGAMIWNIDLDDFKPLCNGKTYPLMRLMREILGDYVPPTGGPGTTSFTTDGPVKTVSPVVTDKPTTNLPGELTCIGRPNFAYFVDTNDCSVYYRCVHGERYEYKCHDGLLWNSILSYCDHARNVECTSVTTEPPTTEPTTETQTTEPITVRPTTERSTVAPTTEPTTVRPTTERTTVPQTTEPITTKKPTMPPTNENFCANKADGLYKKVDDCQSFYTCAHGSTSIVTCPPGTLFNAEAKVCDWKKRVNCDEQETETDFCAGKEARLYPYPKDCSKYYKCGGTSDTAVLTCPSTQYYNEKTRNCDWIKNVNCGQRPKPDDDNYDEVPVNICAEKGDGLYTDPANCHQYIQCAHGVKYQMTCGSLAFNPSISNCDWPANVDC